MKTPAAVVLLTALSQETRLEIFRVLVRAGSGGLSAGAIAEAVGAVASTLSFHLKELSSAGLISARQDGRFIYYAADYAAMSQLVAFLAENIQLVVFACAFELKDAKGPTAGQN